MSTAITPPTDPNEPHRADPERGHGGPIGSDRDSRDVIRRQKERFGGMKFGSCFFGWLTATGTAVLLSALLTAIGFAAGLGQDVTTDQLSGEAQTVGVVGGIVVLVVVLVSYFAGGYVAGRMARFNGIKQGVGVWLWAIVVAAVVAVLSLIVGSRADILSTLSGVPRLPVESGAVTPGGVIAALALIATALIGAILGGLAGMRFHRRVDHADLTDPS
ncbi:MAG: hypothetical protein L0H41_17455 [Microlunatus sp.]|nr:hypothetical protein [Microlunatus sp.]MDN5770968.1 hypothetical protein [Microlunatus sp.]